MIDIQFCWAAACLNDGNEHIDLPTPALLKPVPLWTGKQLYSLIMSPNKEDAVRVNLNFKVRVFVWGVCGSRGVCGNRGSWAGLSLVWLVPHSA